MKRLGLAFILGTFASFATTAYLFYADRDKQVLPYIRALPFAIAIIYGLANILIIHTKQRYTTILGALIGLLFSLLGRFFMGNLPQKLFNFPQGKEYWVHPVAMALYAFYFSQVLGLLNQLYLKVAP